MLFFSKCMKSVRCVDIRDGKDVCDRVSPIPAKICGIIDSVSVWKLLFKKT